MILTLSDLVARVESNRNPYAVRFEPKFRPSANGPERMAKICGCSRATARALCEMSFGYYQIMGDNLIALGLDVSPIKYCNDDAMQLKFFTAYVEARGINYTPSEIRDDHLKRERFALHYNGPANVAAYSQRLLSFLA